MIMMIGLVFVACNMVFEERNSEEYFMGKITSIIYGYEVFGVTVYNDQNDYRKIYLPMVTPSSFNAAEDEAAKKVFDLARKKQVKAKIVESFDEHRRLAFVYIDERDIALLLLKEGYLKVDFESKLVIDYPDAYKEYLDAQLVAQEKNIGMWANDDEPEDKDSPDNSSQ